MITPHKAWKASDGSVHETLESAKKQELMLLLGNFDSCVERLEFSQHTADILIESASKAIDILTTTETSLAQARKANGGTKKRKGKKHLAEQFKTAGVREAENSNQPKKTNES